MEVTPRWSRTRFLRRSLVAAVGFVAAGRSLIETPSALAYHMCEFLSCAPDYYVCLFGTLYLSMTCYDALSGDYCGEVLVAVGCCPY